MRPAWPGCPARMRWLDTSRRRWMRSAPCLLFASEMANCSRWQPIRCCQSRKCRSWHRFCPMQGCHAQRRHPRDACGSHTGRRLGWRADLTGADIPGIVIPGITPLRDRLVSAEIDQFHDQLQSASVPGVALDARTAGSAHRARHQSLRHCCITGGFMSQVSLVLWRESWIFRR